MRKVIKSGFVRNVCMTIDGPINKNTKEELQEGMDGKSRMFFVCAFIFHVSSGLWLGTYL